MQNNKIFEYVDVRGKYDNNFKESIKNMYYKNMRYSGTLIRFVVNISSLLIKPKKQTIDYFFWGNKYDEIILNLPKSKVCVIGGPKQLFFCLRNNIKFLPGLIMWKPLYSYLNGNEDSSLNMLIEKLSREISKYKSENGILVVDNDSLPMQRATISAAKIAKIKEVICIQHGIFQSKSPDFIVDGWYCDRFFVINKIQKELLIRKGQKPNKIAIMGFHHSPYLPNRELSEPEKRKVCFLGQPWIKYGNDKGEKYIQILKKISETLKDQGFDFYYKPHPWENDFSFIPGNINIVTESLPLAFEQFDVFISLTSTALFEAAASGRIAIQVYDEIFECDNMAVYDGIDSIVLDPGYEKKLKNIVSKNIKNTLYPNINNTPVQKFLNLIK